VRQLRVAVLVLSLLAGPVVYAQVPIGVTTAMMPSPLGIVLTVGKWIYDSVTKEQVYYIEVEGRGNTATQARDNGFRLAVEQALGTVIASETEVVNGRVQRDEIISYASGYVSRFELINVESGNPETRVQMKIWISRSALSNRLLARSAKSGEVDGPVASIQLQTLNQERATGDRLLQTVLNDFPKRAFEITLDPTDVVRQNRSAQVEIVFEMRWSQDYLRSLWAALDAVSYRGSNPVAIIGVNSGGLFRGYGGQARFDDTVKYEQLVKTMVLSEPAILFVVRGPNREILSSGCYTRPELDNQSRYGGDTGRRFVELSPYRPTAFVDGSYKMRGRIQIPINNDVLAQAFSVDLDVVPAKNCLKR
jgi:hypothetical protein